MTMTSAGIARPSPRLRGPAVFSTNTDVLWAEPPIFYLARQMSEELYTVEERPLRGYMRHYLVRIALYCTCIRITNSILL
jgi:hypothetical protein